MAQLEKFGSNRINIPQQIVVNFKSFGYVLLKDENGAIVKGIEYKCHHDPVCACKEILEQWLQGAGVKEKTWATIVDVLHDIDLNTLAHDIELVVSAQ